MRTTTLRFLHLPALAVSSLLLLTACGGSDDPAPATTRPDPVQPGQPNQPTQPSQPSQPSQPTQPNQPAPGEPVLASTFTAWSNDTMNNPPGWIAWVAPSSPGPVSGVGCLAGVSIHQHSLISIYKEGVRQGLPDNIGRGGCTYELHTHDGTGVVHIETSVPKKFTLGQFFALWNQPLGVNGTAGLAGPVRFYVIENERLTRHTGDPAALELVAHREIVIISGAAPAVLPKYRWPADI